MNSETELEKLTNQVKTSYRNPDKTKGLDDLAEYLNTHRDDSVIVWRMMGDLRDPDPARTLAAELLYDEEEKEQDVFDHGVERFWTVYGLEGAKPLQNWIGSFMYDSPLVAKLREQHGSFEGLSKHMIDMKECENDCF